MTSVNQKEYLKKYLRIGRAPGDKKKKKKKEKIIGSKLKIIDDDADALISQEIQDDISAANEDAPQIVAVIDERPPSLRIDEQTKSNLWTPIGESSNIGSSVQSLKLSSSFKLSKQTKRSGLGSGRKHEIYDARNYTKVQIEQECDISPLRNESDNSPPRQKVKHKVPPQKVEGNYNYKSNKSTEDHSPPLKRYKNDDKVDDKECYDCSPPRRRNEDDNTSRALKRQSKYDNNSLMRTANRKGSESLERGNIDDSSPLRRKKYSDDHSPARGKSRENNSPFPKKENDEDDDNSPPRKKNKYICSPPSRKHGDERNREQRSPLRKEYKDDNSPQRHKTIDRSTREREKLKDNSPLRRGKKFDEDISPPRMRHKVEEIDNSPPRKSRRADDKQKKSRWGKWSPEASPERPGSSEEKMRKTLDGKKAGLQDAKELVKETTLLRHREDEMFKKLSAEVSGMNAATVVRRKEVKDLEEEARKRDNEKKTKEKYDRWGKGLKQVEDQNERIADQLHEMSKPLARYADDEDLEKYLKEQERDGDPMLAYIRSKKKKKSTVAGTSEKPVYLGEFMPNRFGISPGYRWDGVDRSNGYETKWFQVQNSKRATQEEAFKWSTEDM